MADSLFKSLDMPEDTVRARRPPFDAVTMALHWATVILVLSMFVTAWLHGFAEVRQSDYTLFHHFVQRDDVLICMAPVVADPPPARVTEGLSAPP
jgi:cytochrome b561